MKAIFVVTAVIGIALSVASTLTKGAVYSDLYPTYVAAQLLSENKISSVYANSPYSNTRDPEWARIESTLPDGADKTVFAYSPAYLFAVSGLIHLAGWNYPLFANLFLAINIIALAAVCWLTLRNLRVQPTTGVVLVFLFTTAYATSVILSLGQNMFLLFLAFGLYVRAVFKEKLWISMLAFFIALCLKPWCVLLIILPTLNKNLKIALASIICCVFFFCAQFFIWPELFSGYWRLSIQHSAVSVLAYNNVSLLAEFHRLTLPDWIQYVNWSNAGSVPTVAKVIVLIGALILGAIAWISHRPSVILMCFLMICTFLMNVFWDFYYILFFPIWLELLQRGKGSYAISILLLLCFYFHPVTVYSALSNSIYRILPYSFHDRLSLIQFVLPTILCLYSLGLLLKRTQFKRQLDRFLSRGYFIRQFFTFSSKVRKV